MLKTKPYNNSLSLTNFYLQMPKHKWNLWLNSTQFSSLGRKEFLFKHQGLITDFSNKFRHLSQHLCPQHLDNQVSILNLLKILANYQKLKTSLASNHVKAVNFKQWKLVRYSLNELKSKLLWQAKVKIILRGCLI